jgi:transcriptional regulator with XRE-family HTH domain
MSSMEKISAADIFSERLKACRGERSKADFSRILGVSAQNYQRYEAGRIPDADVLLAISNRCGVTVGWLLGSEACQANSTLREPPAQYAAAQPGACQYPAGCDLPARLTAIESELSDVRKLLVSLLAEERAKSGASDTRKVG